MKILIFGEILWDVFGDKKEIGGAPFNFAAHLTKLSADSYIVSALGNDELGKEANEKINELGINSDYIKFVDKPTGYCKVSFEGNTPNYNLVSGVAYDFIPYQSINGEFDAFYMGTLAQRNDVSRETLNSLLKNHKYKEVFFDINIRQNYYTHEIIENSLRHTTILKISREEIGVFSSLNICPTDDIQKTCSALSEKYHLKLILVTLDKDGAMFFDCKNKNAVYSRKPISKVVSTVGAGDSFSACFLYNYLEGKKPETCLDRAVTLSDYVVTKLGAIPEYNQGLLKQIKG